MRSLGILVVIMFLSVSSFAKTDDPKTIMVLFQAKELKALKTSLSKIEAHFSGVFKTKTYEGNSVPTLVIEVPNEDFDKCMLGEFIINLGNKSQVQLQDIAFRMFDLTKGKNELQSYFSEYEDLQQQRKNDKTAKAKVNP